MPFNTDFPSSTAGEAGKPSASRRGRTAIGALVAASALLVGTAAGAGAHGASRTPVQSQAAMAKASHGKVVKGQVHFDMARYNATFSSGMVAVEGASLHYVKGGSGPALVLLHGWPETSWEWHKVMPELAKTHTVIAIDLPGLGKSTIPSGGFDAAHTAVRLHEAVLALGYHQVQILSHDVGALVAYPYAKQFPNDVSRMAVLETPLNGFGLESAAAFSFHFGLNSSPKPTPEKIVDDSDDLPGLAVQRRPAPRGDRPGPLLPGVQQRGHPQRRLRVLPRVPPERPVQPGQRLSADRHAGAGDGRAVRVRTGRCRLVPGRGQRCPRGCRTG